jgi:hypothetical protein
MNLGNGGVPVELSRRVWTLPRFYMKILFLSFSQRPYFHSPPSFQLLLGPVPFLSCTAMTSLTVDIEVDISPAHRSREENQER